MNTPTSIRFKKPWKIHLLAHLRFFVIIFSLLLVSLFSINKFYDLTQYSFLAYADRPVMAENKDRSEPTFIHIPDLEIALPVHEVSNSTLFWKTKTNYASHLATSAVPGERDNIVLYGRNTTEDFGRFTSLRKGDTIIINTKNGDSHEYIVTQLTIASPSEVDQISSTDEETLTLYTSYGFGGLKRFVVKSLPVLN